MKLEFGDRLSRGEPPTLERAIVVQEQEFPMEPPRYVLYIERRGMMSVSRDWTTLEREGWRYVESDSHWY